MSALERLIELDAVARLRARDASLFSADAEVQKVVTNRLGWTHLAEEAGDALADVSRVAGQARAAGVTDVVLLGMGGSSLAALVIARFLGVGTPKLHVLDTTSPVTVSAVLEEVDPARTVVLVASKSGGTVEPNALYAIFRARFDEALGAEVAGKRFVAITDPGTVLEKLAAEDGFADTVFAPPTVGGRFSAMTVFGLVPAALVGADVALMVERAGEAETVASRPAGDGNEAADLAAFIADSHEAGADKLTVVASRQYATFGLWAEQLVAESLGKGGVGVVPVVELAAGAPSGYGADRAVVVVRGTGDARLAEWAAAQQGVRPVYEIVLDDAYDVAAEFVRWEHAVALAGVLLGVNPFDEPNVAEAKAATVAVLDANAEGPEPYGAIDGVELTYAGGLESPDHAERALSTALGHPIAELGAGDYLTILAYLPDDDELLAPLTAAVPLVSSATGAAVCLERGPRYLHSTGQLHKGGPRTGVFVLVTTRDPHDLAVPEQPWTLCELHRAQAEGDLATLAAHGRRVLRVDLPDSSAESVESLAKALLDGAGVVSEG